MSFKIGSLFDGSGGFPLAATMCGGTPVWASEVEPYPIAVTKSRFPNMKHLGSVTDVKGDEVEPVDVITFGSPCQDLSVAGKRAGLKHEDNGDDETTRSGLFMEAVRIIKEMRRATNGEFPKFCCWENVPGAFSSNKGEDFRTVCEELIKIVEPGAVMPPVPKNGWPYADCYCGEGWSLAYRTFDAQYWGVPQRRRRIYLVLDLRGERAGKILFEREGLRGYFAEGGTPWQGIAADAQNCAGADDREGVSGTLRANAGDNQMAVACADSCVLDDQGGQQITVRTDGKSPTLRAEMHGNVPCVLEPKTWDARGNGDGSVCSTITGGHESSISDFTSVVVELVYCLQGNGIDRADTAGCNGKGVKEDICYTLNTIDRPAVAYGINGNIAGTLDASYYKGCGMRQGVEREVVAYCVGNGQLNQISMVEQSNTLDCMHDQQAILQPVGTFQNTGIGWWNESPVGATVRTPCGGDSTMANVAVEQHKTRYIVRRLTPTECARLQGFADRWAVPVSKDDFTDEEYAFLLNVRNTHAEINGKATKEYTKEQMLKWYNGLHTDSSEYKLWGNGIALPNALYVMQGIADVLNQ